MPNPESWGIALESSVDVDCSTSTVRQQEQRVAHERGTSASSFAIAVRLHVTSGYPYASVVCMGPGYGPLSVYGRCVVLILLVGG